MDTKHVRLTNGPDFAMEVDFFDAEAHRFPYDDARFDMVLCCELIEHLVHDPMHMLVECNRILGDSGTLVVTTPNVASLGSVARVLHGRMNPQVFSRYTGPGNSDTPHVREYTPAELSSAIESAGFRLEMLLTESTPANQQSSWVKDLLSERGFDTALRGDQMYCVAKKHTAPVERYPSLLYVTS
jgi:ubiquinone/menaquinone biosynthesis C-methylase UbiE